MSYKREYIKLMKKFRKEVVFHAYQSKDLSIYGFKV